MHFLIECFANGEYQGSYFLNQVISLNLATGNQSYYSLLINTVTYGIMQKIMPCHSASWLHFLFVIDLYAYTYNSGTKFMISGKHIFQWHFKGLFQIYFGHFELDDAHWLCILILYFMSIIHNIASMGFTFGCLPLHKLT